MKKYLLLILLIFFFPVTIWGKVPAFIPDQSVALVFSSTIQGEVEPCG
jgi:hypothetical protein